MHQHATASRTQMRNSTPIKKCDIWDADTPAKTPHHQFVSGHVYPVEQDSGHDRWKLKLPQEPFSDSALPADVTGCELHCTDDDDETYTGTISECNNRSRHVYVYVPQATPAIYTP